MSIPHELTDFPNWVNYGVDPENPKKPYSPATMQPAKARDPTTWGNFELALQRVTEGKALGIGFEFDGTGIIGVDLDKCRNPDTGEVAPWAVQIVQELDSFTEISMSGTGLHIIIKGQKPGEHCRNPKTGEAIEIYSEGRYFALTGNNYHAAPIAERTAELTAIYNRLWPTHESAPEPTASASDYPADYFLNIGLEKDEKLKAYWHGARPHGNESQDDAGFMAKLMYYCNNDIDMAIRALRVSPYAQQKDEAHKRKLDRPDYLQNTAAAMRCDITAAQKHEQRQQERAERQAATEDKPRRSLNIISAPDLQKAVLPPIKFLIDDFLSMGATILGGSPKSGKSWFVYYMGLMIALGEPFMRWQTKQAGVLYLSFEDRLQRLQERMNKLLNNAPAPPWFYVSTEIVTLEDGLLDLLDEHIKQCPETKLIIIDIFQKIRGATQRGERWYEHDYREAGMIKEFADRKDICVMFVTHTNKFRDKEDPFNELTGTTGISGVMDTMFVLKRPRGSKQAVLYTTGRDVDGGEFVIRLNDDTCQWEFVCDADEQAEQEAEFAYQTSPIVKTIRALLDESPDRRWTGFAKNLLEAGERFLQIPIAPSPQAIGKELTKLKDLLFEQDRIMYTISPHGNAGSKHHFYYAPEPIIEAITGDTPQDDSDGEAV